MQPQIDLATQLFEYNRYANVRILGACAAIDAASLDSNQAALLTEIRNLAEHIVGSESYYASTAMDAEMFETRPQWEAMTLPELVEMAEVTGAKLVEVAKTAELSAPRKRERAGEETFHFYSWTVLVQAIHHGVEHRTQIKALLTQLGVPHQEGSGWEFSVDSTT